MINTEDILQFHMAEVVIEHLNHILFDNHDKPDAGKILGTMIHQCHKMQRELLAGQHLYWLKEYTSNNPSVWTPVRYMNAEEVEASLERWSEFYDRADYLFIKAVVADDKAHAQELIAEALKLSPDCSCLQLVTITCRPLYYKLLGDQSLDRKSRFNAYRFYKAAYHLRPAEDVRERMEGLEGHRPAAC